MVTPQTLVNLPAGLLGLVQEGYLEREYRKPLEGVKAYRAHCVEETFAMEIGETTSKTRRGRKPPAMTPQNPANKNAADFNNGLTPSEPPVERYTVTMAQYGDTIDCNLVDDLVTIASRFLDNARVNGDQAAQTLEWLCRDALIAAYGAGDTRVVTSLGAGSTTTAYLDDLRNFQNIMANGKLEPVSDADSAHRLTCAVTGSVTATIQVIGTTADVPSRSVSPGGISGYITIKTALGSALANGDRVVSSAAPIILRANGKATDAKMVSTDYFTLSQLLDAKKTLEANGIPKHPDGTYHCILDSESMRQLFDDPRFNNAMTGAVTSTEFQNGTISKLLGITFLQTTEAVVQYAGGDVTVNLRRPMLLGAEVLVKSNFSGLPAWVSRTGLANTNSMIQLVDGVAMITRAPLDRNAENVAQTWKWIGGFSAPVDTTTNPSVMPGASNAMYKRGVMMIHAG